MGIRFTLGSAGAGLAGESLNPRYLGALARSSTSEHEQHRSTQIERNRAGDQRGAQREAEKAGLRCGYVAVARLKVAGGLRLRCG